MNKSKRLGRPRIKDHQDVRIEFLITQDAARRLDAAAPKMSRQSRHAAARMLLLQALGLLAAVLLVGCTAQSSAVPGAPANCEWTVNGVSGYGGCQVLQVDDAKPGVLLYLDYGSHRLEVDTLGPAHMVRLDEVGMSCPMNDGVFSPPAVTTVVTDGQWSLTTEPGTCLPAIQVYASGEL